MTGSPLVRAGATLALLGTAHAVLNAMLLRRPPIVPAPLDRDVSVLLPVRDEAAEVADCLAALLALDDADRLEIIVLDDGSSDGTGMIARSATSGRAHVRVLDGAALPDGWLGKPHACRQLADAARPSSRVLVFVDADVRLARHAVRAAVTMLDQYALDLVSPYPRQVAESPAERLVQPLLQWSWLTFLPLRLAERAPRPSLSAANGQFLAIRRSAYDRAGGHAAVRDEVLDDVGLIRAVKAAGGAGGIVDGSTLANCRMYHGWREIRDGYGKSLHSAFGSTRGAAAAVSLLALAYVVPAAAALRGSRAGALGYAAAVAGRVVSARATDARTWPDVLAHPVSIVALGALTARSIIGHRRGTLRWKNRPLAGAH